MGKSHVQLIERNWLQKNPTTQTSVLLSDHHKILFYIDAMLIWY